MLSALYALARPSVCQTGGSVKMVEVRIMKFAPYGSPIPIFFAGQFHPKILMGSPEREVRQGRGGESKPFSKFKRRYLENDGRYAQTYY